MTYTFNPSSLSTPETTNGVYTMAIGVFDSSWSTDYYWNSTAGAITLTGGAGPPAFTSSGTAKPASIAASGSSTVTFSVQDTGGPLSNANVEIQIFNGGTAVGTQVYSGQNFTANGTLSYSYTWTPSSQSPAVTATGTYTAEVGVFDSGWGTDYYWNSNLATINIVNAVLPQAITFTDSLPASADYSAGLTYPLSATGGGSGNPVVFSVLSGPGTVSGSTLSITGLGTVVVAANQAGNATYTAAPQVTQSITITQPAALTSPTPGSHAHRLQRDLSPGQPAAESPSMRSASAPPSRALRMSFPDHNGPHLRLGEQHPHLRADTLCPALLAD